MKYLLDSDFVIQALRGDARTVGAIGTLAADGIAITWLTIGEVYEGAYRSPQPQVRLSAYRAFLSAFPLLALNDDIIERFAEIRSRLRRLGQIMPDIDILVAATALHYQLTVLTYDKHFQRIPGLQLY